MPFPKNRTPRGADWHPAHDAQLGTASDSAVAARLGRTRSAVIARRRALGIPPGAPRGRPTGPKLDPPATPHLTKKRGRPRKQNGQPGTAPPQ